MRSGEVLILISFCFAMMSCGKNKESVSEAYPDFSLQSVQIDNSIYKAGEIHHGVSLLAFIKVKFTAPVNFAESASFISFTDADNNPIAFNVTSENSDSVLIISSQKPLAAISKYSFEVKNNLRSVRGRKLDAGVKAFFVTRIDSVDKFPRISDEALLTLVQQQTFKYFWDLAHPVSGLARERDSSGETVTIGGSGFSVMAVITAISRGFITRDQGLERIGKMVNFLKTKVQTFHGAFPHWINGSTGLVVAFSPKDNGADLVETSFLIQGLLTARQYFNNASQEEATLRNNINNIWREVDWTWFKRNNENVLYWHWSPDYSWEMNLQVRGWNEALITYVLAAASPTFPISKQVYDEGWARNGAIKNTSTYYSNLLPLGEPNGGPLFYAHYSFLGIDPNGLRDFYASYDVQNKAHSFINYKYCIENPRKYYGYSEECWGLTASDDIQGYMTHHPNNDNGVISPTAALSSFPYTPHESMKALKFFYYKLGDKVWGKYGFKDAFSLHEPWFADSFLAINQGPIIVMIENYRSGLLWDLFMSSPEVEIGMKALGFTSSKF
ncbi:glucoamylase family protein [Pararcticibacter amylolyticus]|uniref:Beta-glucosidase n=1 Tax=Pararcticibacter amylolyticus TaxID=2173175 RepID=A0A2U2PEU9_9SPHI|nr:glucoamylase family protein [Pararcticibacter amylolyticus]PWG79880.1 beta-glucosidase [Pararcticibacter amylolyticus]